MKVALLAPHQDDEILSSCLYLQKLRQQNHKISIVFATNGDYKGSEIAKIRAVESLQALSLLGIEKEDVYFMGYADTGMSSANSFLFRLYTSNSNQIYESPFSNKTYHPLGFDTVSFKLFGKESFYNKECFMVDLEAILNYLQPDLLLVPSHYDYHGGHKALGFFVKELLTLKKMKLPVYSYLIHAGDDLLWPNRNDLFFTRPECITPEIWKTRIIHTFPNEAADWKRQIIQLFESQSPFTLENYLYSFAKKEEFFFKE